MTKGKLLTCLRKLNKHYKRRVYFRTGYPRDGSNCPCADLCLQTLFFPPEPLFYDKYVLAHEYAHILDNDVDNGHAPKQPETSHDKEFELFYREVCLVLGVFAISSKELAARILKPPEMQCVNCWHRWQPAEWFKNTPRCPVCQSTWLIKVEDINVALRKEHDHPNS